MSVLALVRGVDGVVILCCTFLVTQAQFASPIVQTPVDWQLKMALFIVTMEAFVSVFMILALQRLRQCESSDGRDRSGVVTFCGILSQLVAVAIVLPCMRTVYWYAHLGRSLTRYSYATHVTLPVIVCISEVSLSIACILKYLHSWSRDRHTDEDRQEEIQKLQPLPGKTQPPAPSVGDYMAV